MDESLKEEVEKEAVVLARKKKVASAGGEMISAAFAFISELFPEGEEFEQTRQVTEAFKQKLSEGIERGDDGKLNLTISFPDESALDNLAKSLARMVGMGNRKI